MSEVMEKVGVPDFNDTEALTALLSECQAELASDDPRHGMRSLATHLAQVIGHTRYRDEHIAAVKTSINTVNGIRAARGERKQQPMLTAQRFFAPLKGNEAALKAQCKAYGLRYDMYDSEDELITALVQAYVEMQGE